MRKVEKVICLIKASDTVGTPVVLNYMSPDWRMSLFPNINLPKQPSEDLVVIASLLGERLDLPAYKIQLLSDCRDPANTTSQRKVTADLEKVAKYGAEAEYVFHYVPVKITAPPERICRRMFTSKDITLLWRSLPALKRDEAVRHHNYDIIEFLSERYDQTLALLPPAFSQRVASSPFDDDSHYDCFISHAHEDKEDFARPLAQELRQRGLAVWFDEFTLRVGQSLLESIDHGLAHSRFGIVVLSPFFFNKKWPRHELDGLVALEDCGKNMILPVWHNVTVEDVRQASPSLAGRVATNSSLGLAKVVEDILGAMGLTADYGAS